MNLFPGSARQRLIAIHPDTGTERFERLCAFTRVASEHPGVPLVVPPGIDEDIHEVLSVRDDEGRGIELVHISHVMLEQPFPPSVGKRLEDLDHPLARATINVLDRAGVHLDPDARYAQPACSLTVLAA